MTSPPVAFPSPFSGSAPSRDNLSLLYQGVLTAIVRVQSGRQPITDSVVFRKRMRDMMDQISREALRMNYESQDIADGQYAIVAFLDEAIAQSKDPNRSQWQSLQAELYGEAVAGDGFFERLRNLRVRRDSPILADILELYYLCLLLGYRGRFALSGEAELSRLMEELGGRVRSIRGANDLLSPNAIPRYTHSVHEPRGHAPRVALWIIFALVIAVSVWCVARLLLYFQARDVIEKMHLP